MLQKNGYIASEYSKMFLADDCYTEKTAKAVCTRMKKQNHVDRDFERKEEQYHISKGGLPKQFYINYECTFEPIEVNVYSI